MHEFVPIPIDRRTLIPKNGGKASFSMKPKNQFIYPNAWNEFVTPNLMEINLDKHLFPTILVILCKE